MSTKKPGPPDDGDWVSQAEAARLKGVSRQAIRNLIRRGKLTTRDFGGRTFVSRGEVIGHEPQHPGRPSLSAEQERVESIMRPLQRAPRRIQREVYRRLRSLLPRHRVEEEFGVDADVILEAIARSSDLSKRGIRGLIAEACFKISVIDALQGWQDITPTGDHGFDFLIRRAGRAISIQVKMLRRKSGRPMHANEAYRRFDSTYYVVETQRTRGGRASATGEDTRPYRFGEFDILAVSMAPLTGDWSEFRFAVASALLPRPEDSRLIMKFQPVSHAPNEDWADSLRVCIERLDQGGCRMITGGG